MSSIFLHANFLHLTINMLSLLFIGAILEKRISRIAYLFIYLLSGVVSGLVSATYNYSSVVVSCGASGAILGLVGVLISYIVFRNGIKKVFVYSLLINLVITFSLGFFLPIDNMAHIGGLIFGFFTGCLLVLLSRRPGIKSESITLSMLLVCSLGMTSVTYARLAILGGHNQVMSAKIIKILGYMGFGSASEMVTGVYGLNKCIDLHINAGSLNNCGKQQEYDGIETKMVAKSLQQIFDSCLPLVEALENEYPAIEDRDKLSVVKRYCETRKQLYGVVFGTSTQSVDIEKLQAADSDMRHVADGLALLNRPEDPDSLLAFGYLSSHREEEDDDDFQDIATSGVLNDVSLYINKTVHAAACPYVSCERK